MANRWGNNGNSDILYFGGGTKITVDGGCNHEIKRHLLFGRKVITNLDSILKSWDMTLPTKLCLVKALVSPVVMYGCESWTLKKAECQRIDAFLKNHFVFCWKIIVLLNFAFCQTSTWISHKYTYIPSFLKFPPPSPSHPSRVIQSCCLSFLRYIANSHWLSILHMIMWVFMLLFPYISPSYPLSPCP